VWDPTSPSKEFPFLDRAVPVADRNGIRLVLTLYPSSAAAPDPQAFCDWAGTVARRYRSIKTFIIGNEVNTARFWSPQHANGDADAGARSYYAVLTRCYDELKGLDAGITVVGLGLSPRAVDGNSTAPLAFLRALGRIYRADTQRSDPETGTPIMDELAVHPYPNPNANPQPGPDKGYEQADFFGVSQLDRVEQAVYDAFNGTAQPTTVSAPASSLRTTASPAKLLKLKIAEYAYQVKILQDYAGLYTGAETSPTVDEQTQAAFLAAAISKYLACRGSIVSEVLLFHLIDEKDLARFQSGLERVDGSHRPAFDAVRQAIAGGCTGNQSSWQPRQALSPPATSGTTNAKPAKPKRPRHHR
jgi:hypothetical protein